MAESAGSEGVIEGGIEEGGLDVAFGVEMGLQEPLG